MYKKKYWTPERVELLKGEYEKLIKEPWEPELGKMELCERLASTGLFPGKSGKSLHYAIDRYVLQKPYQMRQMEKQMEKRKGNIKREEEIEGFDAKVFLQQLTCLIETIDVSYIQELRQQNEEYRQRLKIIEVEYEKLNQLVEEWTKLSTISRMTGFAEFGSRLKIAVDKFGIVLCVSKMNKLNQTNEGKININ